MHFDKSTDLSNCLISHCTAGTPEPSRRRGWYTVCLSYEA